MEQGWLYLKKKMKMLKNDLKIWNNSSFGIVTRKKNKT